MYSMPLLISSMDGFFDSSPTLRLRVQNRQYMAHSFDTKSSTRSGYLWTIVRGPPSGMSPSSSSGSGVRSM